MAINVTDVQGTKLYLAAFGTDVSSVANIEAAIAAGDQIGCLQSIGTISETVNVQEYQCISSDESAKSIGTTSRGNFALSTLFNSADAAGQAELTAMWNTKTRRVLIIELNDDAGVSPTYVTFDIFLSSRDIGLEKDNAVMYDVTVEIASSVTITLAT